MAYINNSKLKAKLAYIFHYSDLSRPQRDVFDNACRLAGGGRGLSRSRILRLLQTLDTLTYDSLERRLNVSLKALNRESYSKRTIVLYLSVCRKVASQLAQMYGIQRHEITIPEESEPQYSPSVLAISESLLLLNECYRKRQSILSCRCRRLKKL